ncbi:hypothetical protein AAC387_Pa11g0810 [Persea americana]
MSTSSVSYINIRLHHPDVSFASPFLLNLSFYRFLIVHNNNFLKIIRDSTKGEKRSVCTDLWWTTDRTFFEKFRSRERRRILFLKIQIAAITGLPVCIAGEDEEGRCRICLNKQKDQFALISGAPQPEKTDQTSPSLLIAGTGKERSAVATGSEEEKKGSNLHCAGCWFCHRIAQVEREKKEPSLGSVSGRSQVRSDLLSLKAQQQFSAER